jgi:tetratricopeptide (TPR) repeat protein
MKPFLFPFLFLILSACNMSSAKSIEDCAKIYHTASNNPSNDSQLKLAEYLQNNGQGCMQHDEYNVWLVSAYQDAGEYAKSLEIAKKALESASEYKPNLLQFIAEAEFRTGDEEKAVKMGKDIMLQYPNYSPILGFLAEIATKNKDFEASFKYGEKSYQIEKNAGSLLWMAADLHQLERHEEAVNAVYKALEIEPQRIQRVAGVLEGIVSLAALNRKEEATELAKRHIAANPNWQDNPTFVQVAKALGLVK